MTITAIPSRTVRLSLAAVAAAAATAALVSAPPAAAAAAAARPDAVAPAVRSVACGHDIWALSITPAPGFNPLTATAAQLDANGYPERPRASTPHELAQWRSYATGHHAEKTSCAGLRPDPQLGASLAPPPASRPRATADASPDTRETAYWSGYGAAGSFTDAEAEWDVPAAASTPLANVASVAWVGIGTGDDRADPLLQAGSWSGPGGSVPYLWLEVVPEESVQRISNVSPTPGDLVGVHVTEYPGYKPSGCTAADCGTFHVWDETKDFDKTWVVGGDWNAPYTATWIYERPCSGSPCEIKALTDAPPTFTEAQAATGGDWHPLGALNGLGYTATIYSMYNCTNQELTSEELAHPWSIGDGGYDFSSQWLAYGTADACNDTIGP